MNLREAIWTVDHAMHPANVYGDRKREGVWRAAQRPATDGGATPQADC